MAAKAPFWTRPHLFVQVNAGTGSPYAVRVNSRKLVGLVLFLGIAYCVFFTGSLLFFRELEVSRKLQEKVLEFETAQKLSQQIQLATRNVATSQVAGPEPLVAAKPAAAPVPVSAAQTTAADPKTAPVASVGISARVADLVVTCNEEGCQAKVSMIPVSTGVAQGQLLVILETEIPRIGSANPGSNVRKRYFTYPSNQTKDDMTQQDLERLPRKAFRFSRALQTTVTFNTGKLLRPLALNVYLFDSAGTRTHHERKAIDREE
jgi:hypothetical protein